MFMWKPCQYRMDWNLPRDISYIRVTKKIEKALSKRLAQYILQKFIQNIVNSLENPF